MSDAYKVVRDFEAALCEYSGAKYAVTTNSCTMALLLAVKYYMQKLPKSTWEYPEARPEIEIPKHTYVSVPQSIIHAGGKPIFRDEEWKGSYQLFPLPVWDSARYFTSGLYKYKEKINDQLTVARDCSGQFVCVSFHASKTLGDTQGGAILHDSDEADIWLRKARFDGRSEGVAPKDDVFDMLGYHCCLSPDVAARLLLKLSVLPKNNPPLPNDDYPSLDKFEVFK